jgi:hypothetical protein
MFGPPVLVLGTSIEENGGVIPADGTIELAFNRYLLPATITRQSFAIVDSSNALVPGLVPKTIYDPVARTVTIYGPDGPGRPWLTPDASYKLVLFIPKDPNSDIGGYRALDRAPLDSKQKLVFVFRAGPPNLKPAFEPSVDFCTDVFPIFVARCNGGGCHEATTSAAAGLILASAEGVRTTALGRVAHGSNVNGSSSEVAPTPSQFGANMAIIAPGDPGSSWLSYKLELARPLPSAKKPNVIAACIAPPTAPPAPAPAPDFFPVGSAQIEPSESERGVLASFMLGREMPYPYVNSDTALDFQQKQRIRIWIARGAAVRDCGTCEAYPR